VVQCNKSDHSDFADTGILTMSEPSTLIILAESEGRHLTGAPCVTPAGLTPDPQDALDTLRHSIRAGLASGLQVILVASPMMAAQIHHLLPPDRIVLLPDAVATGSQTLNDQMALGVAVAVISSAQSPGWLLLPGDLQPLQIDTLKTMGEAVTQNPVVFPEYRHRRGHPIGFSAEFYSELIRLQRERDLRRLLAKYPARGIKVNDPGILMPAETDGGQALLQAALQGNAALIAHH